MRKTWTAAAALASGALVGAEAPTAARFELTVDSIMRGPKLVGHPPTGLRFSGDSRDLYFEWRLGTEDETATYVVPRAGGLPRRLSDDERKAAPAPTGAWDRERRRLVFEDQGDIVVVDTIARTRRQVTRTAAAETRPRWARADSHVTFTRDNGLFIVPVGAGGDGLVELMEAALPKAEPKLTESQKLLREEETRLLEAVREAAEKRKKEEEKRKKAAPPRLEVAEGQSLREALLSPDGRRVFAVITDKAQGARVADMPRYVTESAYADVGATRTKVGDAQERRRLVVFDLEDARASWASAAFAGKAPPPTPAPGPGSPAPSPPAEDFASPTPEASPSPLASPSPEARPSPAASPAPPPSPASSPSPPGPKERQDAFREVVWSLPALSRDGKVAVASVRSADFEDRWIVAVDPSTADTRVLFHEHDEAWVRAAWNADSGPYGESNFGLLPDDRTVWFLSEREGWNHLYAVDAVSGSLRQLTSGPWEITWAELTPQRRRFLLTTTEAGAAERHLYAMELEGGARTRLTSAEGAHAGILSPDERTLADIHSTASRPPEVFVGEAGKAAVRVTTSTTEEWRSFPWIEPELVAVIARDGVRVPARLFTPERLGKTRDPRRPAVVFIHGAGYLQNAHRYWSTYYREYMFHHLLASRGYVVLDVDYRGSAGYGRDWRTAIATHMGGKDLDDIVDAAGWLVRAQGVDARRIGVYGGSYGGFLTLMALFTSPDTFAAGAALRPVTDWAHYNHGYTSAILDRPQDTPAAYRRSSPIHFAEGLKAPLLICHGMVDDNVHFQDSVRLAQRLIELRKTDWELAAYPVERHAFEQETSWADEYRRILALFERVLRPPSG